MRPATPPCPPSWWANAQEYYDHTVELGAAAADLTYQDMVDFGVGIEAPDDYTLVFTCKNPCTYFDTVAGYACFMPASEELISSLGIEGFRAATNAEMWYCGPYLVEEYIQGNSKSFIPNPNWYGPDDHARFERVVVTMLGDLSVGYQLYQNRELDEIDLTESNVTMIQNDPSSEYNSQLCEKRPRSTATRCTSTTSAGTRTAPPMTTGTRPSPTPPSVSASPRAWI